MGELLFCEHDPPVYTFGLRETDYQARAAQLERLGAEVHKVIIRPFTNRLPNTFDTVILVGEERWSHNLPRSRTVSLLPCPQLEKDSGEFVTEPQETPINLP